VPIAGQIGFPGIPTIAPFIPQQPLNQNHPGLTPMWNANHWQQWNFQPSWGNPLIIHGQPPPPPPPVNVPLPPLPHQAPPPPPPEENPLQGMSMSDAEINFDHQFNDWENRFLAWKEENKNHPDKVIAYLHF